MNRRDSQEYRRKYQEITAEYKKKLAALKLVYGVDDREEAEKARPKEDARAKKRAVKEVAQSSVEEAMKMDELLAELNGGNTKVLTIADMARKAIVDQKGPFTVRDIINHIHQRFGTVPPATNISHFLKRQAVKEFGLEVLQERPGSPSVFKKP